VGIKRIALVGPTAADARDTMVEGESGLLSVYPAHERPHYEPSKRRITFRNGGIATCFSAEEPERLRGPQHEAAWCDELAAWKYFQETWDNLQFGLRKGATQLVITTTPKNIKLLRDLKADPTVHVTVGSSYENRDNLSASFFEKVIKPYEGTRLGRQEINAEILEDIEGALWQRSWIDQHRIREIKPRQLQRIVIAIDPAVTSTKDSDETGIVAAAKGVDGRGYVLDDLSCRLSPDGWGNRAVAAYRDLQADKIIAETNNGGDLVETVIRTIDRIVPFKKVHAAKGKITRAEPIAALYEQGRISHVGSFPLLEDQMCQYTGEPGEKSPDRMDALVWALSELFIESQGVKPKVAYL
jgi:predicted phage terminase large subunit-like protein